MLRDRYQIDKFFEEIMQLMPKMDPTLSKIDQYLNDDELLRLIQTDLAKRWAKSLQTGRNSTPVEVVLRMLVVKRLYRYSYEETSVTFETAWCCDSFVGCISTRCRMTRP